MKLFGCAYRCKKFRKSGVVGSFWRPSLLCIAVRAKILSDYAWTSATSKHATFLGIIRLYLWGTRRTATVGDTAGRQCLFPHQQPTFENPRIKEQTIHHRQKEKRRKNIICCDRPWCHQCR